MSSSKAYLDSITNRVKYLKHRRYETNRLTAAAVQIDMFHVAETVVAIRYMFLQEGMHDVPIVRICGDAWNTWLEFERENLTYKLNDGDWLLITSSWMTDRQDIQTYKKGELEHFFR